MAQAPRQPTTPHKMLLKKYYIYDPHVGEELGGTPVEVEGEGDAALKYVRLTPEQAKYWVSQLGVGEKKFGDLDSAEQQRLNKMWGGKLIKEQQQGG